jgi:hypothetical protein
VREAPASRTGGGPQDNLSDQQLVSSYRPAVQEEVRFKNHTRFVNCTVRFPPSISSLVQHRRGACSPVRGSGHPPTAQVNIVRGRGAVKARSTPVKPPTLLRPPTRTPISGPLLSGVHSAPRSVPNSRTTSSVRTTPSHHLHLPTHIAGRRSRKVYHRPPSPAGWIHRVLALFTSAARSLVRPSLLWEASSLGQNPRIE